MVIVLDTEIRAEDAYIGLIFVSCPSTDTLSAFERAAARWSDIILENEIAPTDVSNLVPCGFLSSDHAFPSDTVVDHLIIFVEPIEIDGGGGILGLASPCVVTNGFPVVGGMQFDEDDLDNLQDSGTLEAVILHEMGHVLGIGSRWGRRVQDRVYTIAGDEIIRVNLEIQPKYLGICFSCPRHKFSPESLFSCVTYRRFRKVCIQRVNRGPVRTIRSSGRWSRR